MAPKRKNVYSLQDLSIKRLCRDTVRHAVKYKAEADKETSSYLLFQMLYNDLFLEELRLNSKDMFLEKDTTSPIFTDCVNFIFNPRLKRLIFPPSMDFTKEVASVMSTNCKKLNYLQITGKRLASKFCVDFLKCLKNLVVLDLNACSFESVSAMSAIADSLLHLKVLNLKGTDVDDQGILALCGHERNPNDPVPSCSITENCYANCKLKLDSLSLAGSNVSNRGLESVLTHMATIKIVEFDCYGNPSLKLGRVIRDVSARRRALKMADLQFQLETVNSTVYNFEELQAVVSTCQKLQTISMAFFAFEPQVIDTVGTVLAESKLDDLEELHVCYDRTHEVFTDGFKRFWSNRGSQLQRLHLLNLGSELGVERNVEVIKYILALCPNLTHLVLYQSFEDETEVTASALPEFSVLPDLISLVLNFYGETDFVNSVACKMILSAPNLDELALEFPVNETILFPCIAEQFLPFLTRLIVEKGPTGRKIKKFLLNETRTVEVFVL